MNIIIYKEYGVGHKAIPKEKKFSKKLVNPAIKLELKKAVNPAIKLELKKGRLECKALIFFTNNFKLLEEKCLEYTIIDRSLHG